MRTMAIKILVLSYMALISLGQWTTEYQQSREFPYPAIKVYVEKNSLLTISSYFNQSRNDIDFFIYKEGSVIGSFEATYQSFSYFMPETLTVYPQVSAHYYIYPVDYNNIIDDKFYTTVYIDGALVINRTLVTGDIYWNTFKFQIPEACMARVWINNSLQTNDFKISDGSEVIQYKKQDFSSMIYSNTIETKIGKNWKLFGTTTTSDQAYDTFNISFKIQVFRDPQYPLSNSAFQCLPNCSSVLHGFSSQTQPFDCSCQQNFMWNRTLFACIPQCYRFQHAYIDNIALSSCICSLPYTWDSQISKCKLECSLIQNTNGHKSENECQCIDGYIWSAPGMQCTENSFTILGQFWDQIIGLAITAGILFFIALILGCKSINTEKDINQMSKQLEKEEQKSNNLLKNDSFDDNAYDTSIVKQNNIVISDNTPNLNIIPPPINNTTDNEQKQIRQSQPDDNKSLQVQKDQKFRNTLPAFLSVKNNKKEEEDKDLDFMQLKSSKSKNQMRASQKKDAEQAEINANTKIFMKELEIEGDFNQFKEEKQEQKQQEGEGQDRQQK